MTCVFPDCPVNVPHADARTIAERVGIHLEGEEGHPFHCGERMRTKGGIAGTDYAECKCGLIIANAGSPHINGGYILSEDLYEHFDAMWFIAADPATVISHD